MLGFCKTSPETLSSTHPCAHDERDKLLTDSGATGVPDLGFCVNREDLLAVQRADPPPLERCRAVLATEEPEEKTGAHFHDMSLQLRKRIPTTSSDWDTVHRIVVITSYHPQILSL